MDETRHSVARCRALLRDVTPLQEDCGRFCGAACCRSLPGEETGMLLFPGEETFYAGRPDFRLRQAAMGTLVICGGACSRSERPLACRMFPLLPVLRGADGLAVKIALDARSRAVCPLASGGLRGMREDFRAAVRQCGEILAEDGAQRAFLLALTREQDELRALRRELTPAAPSPVSSRHEGGDDLV